MGGSGLRRGSSARVLIMPTILVMGMITMVWVSFWKRRAPMDKIMHVKQVVKSCSMACSWTWELMLILA